MNISNGILQDKDLHTFEFTNKHKFKFNITIKYIEELEKKSNISVDLKEEYILFKNQFIKEKKLPFKWTVQEDNQFTHIPDNKKLEYIFFRYRFTQYPKKKIVSKFPNYILIEPASSCNLRCQMCYQTDSSFTTKEHMGMMSFDTYKSIIDQSLEGGAGAVTFGSRGEPLFNKRMPEFLDYIKDKFFEVKLITNASFLTEELCHSILKSNISLLTFSVDSYFKEEYEEIRSRGDFNRVLDNIKRFIKIRKDHYPESKTISRVSGVKVLPKQDAKKFNEFWTKITDEVGMKEAYERWDTYFNEPHPELTTPCNLLWERMYIWHDGKVNTCDSDYKSNLSYGNIKEYSIKELWHNQQMENLRKDHLCSNRDKHFPCDRCGFE